MGDELTAPMRDRIPRPVIASATPAELRRYKEDYERGWNYATHSADPSLDHLDAGHARDAEYDGYHDASASRAKWHLLHCPDHDTCDGDLEVMAGRQTPDDVITRITEAATEAHATAIAAGLAHTMLVTVADQLHIDMYGHADLWIRRAIVAEARS
jgi:hypothetical protein